MQKYISRILSILYVVAIPIIYYFLAIMHTSSSVNSGLIAQLVALVLMIPYFIKNRDKYNKVDKKMLSACLSIFLTLQGLYFLAIVVLGGTSVMFKMIHPATYVICGVIMAPIVEEMYFRGILVDALNFLPNKIVTFITALAFSLAHLIRYNNIIVLAVLFLFGLKQKTLRDEHNNLLPSMTLHATWNFLCILIQKF